MSIYPTDKAVDMGSPAVSANKEAASVSPTNGPSELALEYSIEHPEGRTRVPKLDLQVDARIVSDAILGVSDGLTVPFALTAGLSSFGTTKIVILGGLAELVAGAISMGLGGFIGAQSEV